MSEQAEFVLIERKGPYMPKKTSVKYYLNYGRTIPLGNKQAFKPSDLKVGMVIEGNFKQGVVIETIEPVTDNKGENHWKIKVGGQTAGGEYFEFSDYQTVIADRYAVDLINRGQ
jgi:hypothetical protein